jgi:hypothetical protein
MPVRSLLQLTLSVVGNATLLAPNRKTLGQKMFPALAGSRCGEVHTYISAAGTGTARRPKG